MSAPQTVNKFHDEADDILNELLKAGAIPAYLEDIIKERVNKEARSTRCLVGCEKDGEIIFRSGANNMVAKGAICVVWSNSFHGGAMTLWYTSPSQLEKARVTIKRKQEQKSTKLGWIEKIKSLLTEIENE